MSQADVIQWLDADDLLAPDKIARYFARVIASSDGVSFVPDSPVMYRMSGRRRLSHIDHADDRKLASLLLSMRLQVQYLRAIEDSERVRRACVEYLHRLEPPKLPRKYDWIRPLFGWEAAKRMQAIGPAIRWSIVSRWDKMLAHDAGQP